jgi:hypothetical protein
VLPVSSTATSQILAVKNFGKWKATKPLRITIRSFFSSALILALSLFSLSAAAEKMCSYSTYQWNTFSKRAVNYHRVEKPWSEIEAREIDAMSGCSVCEQDQVTITIDGVKPFKLCHRVAAKVKHALLTARQRGYEIHSVIAYRNGMTRGDPDAQGNRTQFSNHSFGIAIDVNQGSNGLYTNCFSWGPQCRLIRAGEWKPEQNPLSLTADSELVLLMKQQGFKWGGEIQGRQKDFMHFSLTGY